MFVLTLPWQWTECRPYSSNAGPASAASTVKDKEEDSKRRELDDRPQFFFIRAAEAFTPTDTHV